MEEEKEVVASTEILRFGQRLLITEQRGNATPKSCAGRNNKLRKQRQKFSQD